MTKTSVYLIAIFFQLIFVSTICAQQTDKSNVNTRAPADTAEFYHKLFEYSKERKPLFFLYRVIFHPTLRTVKVKGEKRKIPALSENIYQGKIIRNVHVLNMDPFGTNINDTTKNGKNFFQRSGNVLHIESKDAAIRNYLLFAAGDTIDPLELEESERLLRSTTFIRDVRIVIAKVPGSKDSVDVHVITQDYWSLKFNLDDSHGQTTYRITEQNLLGFGHEFDNSITNNKIESTPLVLDGSYLIPTISNTYISPALYYGTGSDNNVRGIKINRPFYSPLTSFAWGLDLISKTKSDSIRFPDDSLYNYSYRSMIADAWVGYSIKLRNGQTNEERSTRLISAVRFARERYPEFDPDITLLKEYFSKSDLYLGSISLSTRRYLREKYVLKFGENEDIPDGTKLTFTGGLEDRLKGPQYYFGIDGAIGRYFPNFGYLYFGSGYSTFLKNGDRFQSSITANVIYFSPLAKIRKWRVRQFGNFNFIHGIDRRIDESLKLNNDIGLPGYKSDSPSGTRRMVLLGQTVFYTPYEFLGFRFAPIIIAGVGMVGDENNSLARSRVYQMYGIGLLVKNELLILNTVQLILAFYPALPDGTSGIRFNPISFAESRFRDFEVTRPDISPFE